MKSPHDFEAMSEEEVTVGSSFSENAGLGDEVHVMKLLHAPSPKPPTESSKHFAFFCQKRAAPLLGCIATIGVSAFLYWMNSLYGGWQYSSGDNEDTTSIRSLEPANSLTLLMMLISMLLLLASLSTLMVLLVYVYKRDAKEYQDALRGTSDLHTDGNAALANQYTLLQVEQPHLKSSKVPSCSNTQAPQGIIGFFCQRYRSHLRSILSMFLASFFLLVIGLATSTTLFWFGLVVFTMSYLVTARFLSVSFPRALQDYQAVQGLRRKLQAVVPQEEQSSAFWEHKRAHAILQVLVFALYSFVFFSLVGVQMGALYETTFAYASLSVPACLVLLRYLDDSKEEPESHATLSVVGGP